MTLETKIFRMCVTAIAAFAVGKLVSAPLFFILWPGLYLAWGYWSRRRASAEPGAPRVVAEKQSPRIAAANAPPGEPGAAAANKRSVLGRNMLIAGLVIVGLIVASVLFAFLARELSYRKAERARSSVHAGMSVAEVWHSVTGWILLGASSDVPETDPDLHHAVNLSFHSQSNKFFYFERARGADRELSQSEALGVLHQKLGDGTKWRFKYTFINDTPQHFSFTVVFDKNGRVQEVTPIYGWD